MVALSFLFYLKVACRHGSGCEFVISDCDRCGCRSLDWGFVTSDCDRRGSLGCGGFVCVCFASCFAHRRDGLWVYDFEL